jgi:hypothetical protein
LKPILCFSILTLSGAMSAQGALIAHYQMDLPSPQDNPFPLDANRPAPDLVAPGGGQTPTHLVTGGVSGSGAYQFDGVDDYFGFASPGYLFLGNGTTHNWTYSFWINTTDAGSNTAGYAGTPQVPVLGEIGGGINYGIGIDGGKATMKVFAAGWNTRQGATNIADGQGHFVTMTLDTSPAGDDLLNIYIDGNLDFTGTVPVGGGELGGSLGRSYATGVTHKYGAFTIDDMRIYDTVLNQLQIREELGLPIPEPGSLALAGAAGLMLLRRRRSQGEGQAGSRRSQGEEKTAQVFP